MKLRHYERLFGLDEEINRQLPCVRSFRLVREERYRVRLKCIAQQLKKYCGLKICQNA